MAYTRDDFFSAIATEISNKPLAAQYYQAGDPRLLAQMGAMATMLSMLSQQLDAVSMEPFTKARDTTVLADAAVKGILPFARPPRLTVSVTNGHAAPLNIAVGRRMIDSNGRIYVAETVAAIGPGDTGSINVKQVTTRTLQHKVANSVPFYGVQVPPSTDADLTISGVMVSIGGVLYPYTPEFANLGHNEPGFSLETDEFRRLWVKFGWADTFGVQPTNGTVIDFTIEETYGETALPVNAPFTLESFVSPADQLATIKLAKVIYPGANPVDIESMREWAKYPSTYDASAVYMGNFDFLVRRNLFPLRFLSIWNEQVEEAVRGPSIKNINRLFIAAKMDGVDVAWMKSQITKIIKDADDSYWLKFVDPVEVELPITIHAQVSVVHDVGDVEAKIRAVVCRLYGRDSKATRQGMLMLNSKRVSEALKKEVVALQDDGSDFQVVIPPQANALPEQYRYVSPASLVVNVTQATYNDGMWSH